MSKQADDSDWIDSESRTEASKDSRRPDGWAGEDTRAPSRRAGEDTRAPREGDPGKEERISRQKGYASRREARAGMEYVHDPYWHSRGYLPHLENVDGIQMITCHLIDSLPAEARERMANERGSAKGEAAYRYRLEKVLDAGRGSCLLARPECAAIVVQSLRHFEAKRYRLHAWVVMPNHIHALIEPIAPHPLGEIIKGWKSFTARLINKVSRRTGPLWEEDYWDRFVRNERHYQNALRYIHYNPVVARLANRPQDWPWSSFRQWERGNPDPLRP